MQAYIPKMWWMRTDCIPLSNLSFPMSLISYGIYSVIWLIYVIKRFNTRADLSIWINISLSSNISKTLVFNFKKTNRVVWSFKIKLHFKPDDSTRSDCPLAVHWRYSLSGWIVNCDADLPFRSASHRQTSSVWFYCILMESELATPVG